MKYTEQQMIHSFRIVRIRRSEELGGNLVEMAHEKTGARLCWLDNGAENKTFSISFRTLPTDNTGVFHILEHSVLCGSEKYPVREPFVELLKGSMNTFLNAMTFPDMTMYPVASRNNRDLLNLTEVYLDAVFRPRILQDERVFRQEGWHIEPDENGSWIYKGVVFNEMKGAMSDVSELGEREIARQLFPDTGYGFNSGGDPEAIPTLTYARYRETYLRHYHPSNSWIYLDGDVPLEEMLRLIASYLDQYEKEADLPRFVRQQPTVSVREKEFELGQEEDPANRGHLYLSRILGSWQDKTRNMAATILGDVLTGNNDAPLKRLILEKGLAQNFSLSVDDSALESVLTLHAENVTDGKEQEILDCVSAFADRLEKDGLDPAAVEASLNRFAFALKEEDEPQGIDRAIRVMGSWLYDGDPMFALENDVQLAELRRMLASGAFNPLAVSLLKDQTGLCRLSLHPSRTLGEEKRREEEARLRKITSAWTPAERDANDSLLSLLRNWQETPDSPEALATLPMLKKEDADIPPEWPETDPQQLKGVPLLFHAQPTGGIVHLRASFCLSDCTVSQLQDLNLICGLLGKLPTAHYSSAVLQQEIKRHTGRLGFTVTVRPHPRDPGLCSPSLVAFTSVLKESAEKAQELLAEILRYTDFSATDKIMEIVLQLEMISRQRIVGSGHVIGVRQVLSHYSAEQALKNALEGDQAVFYLHSLAAEPEQMLPDLRKTAEKLLREIVCKKRLKLSLTAGDPVSVDSFLSSLPEGSAVPEYASFTAGGNFRQGYRIPAQVGFAVRGWHLSGMDARFHGSLLLLANILTYSYLWNKVRVQGGAYGCGFQADRFGNLFSYSYRDPSPDRTLDVDRGASAFLREFLSGGESLDKYIISTLNDLNPLLSPREKGAVADIRYLTGYTWQQAEELRSQILHATPADLEKAASLLDAFAEKGAVCVVAPDALLEKCSGLTVADL